jgi:DNA-binding HxlR family transcriptional regulator
MAKTPRPGRAVRGSRTGRPIMALLDLLGQRWTLRVVWELRAGRLTFRALQEACDGMSPTVLNGRLKALRESGLVDQVGSEGYGLTPLGGELLEVFLPVVAWSKRWARRP